MKSLSVVLSLLFASSAAFADQSASSTVSADQARLHSTPTTVRWDSIVGVITAQGVDNPVSNGIHSGTFAWTTSGGQARVDLATGVASFDVEGLVINGTVFSGTPGPISSVTGTLVCNPGDLDSETPVDTAVVQLDARGNAMFAGTLAGIPAPCANPLFLVRIAVLPGAVGRWIATGAERHLGSALQ